MVAINREFLHENIVVYFVRNDKKSVFYQRKQPRFIHVPPKFINVFLRIVPLCPEFEKNVGQQKLAKKLQKFDFHFCKSWALKRVSTPCTHALATSSPALKDIKSTASLEAVLVLMCIVRHLA